MSAELQKQFERLEDQRAALFSRVEGLDEGALNQPPAEGKWSIIQVMSHLTVAEKASLDYIRKKMIYRANLRKAGLAGRLKSAFLHLVLRLPLRIKARAGTSTVPEHQELETTRRQWDEVRAAWRETIDSFPPELSDQGVFRHPVVGLMSLTQTLRFMADHVGRHAKQIDRIVRAG